MTKQSKRKIRWIIIAVIVLMIMGASAYYESTKAVEVKIAKAGKGTIRAYIDERARTTLPHVYHMTMPEAGRILPITLQEGAAVKAGQVIAEMDIADLKDALSESTDMVAAMANAVNASRAKIKAGKSNMDYAKWLVDAREQLFKDQRISEMEYKESEKAYIESEVSLDQDTFILHAMSALEAATRLMPIYIHRRLKRAVLTSPIDGTVLKRYVQNERVLEAGERLLDIGDMDQLEVTVDVLSDDAMRIQPGNPVEVRGAATGGKTIRGTVKRIHPEGFTKLSSLGVEQQRIPVVVTINKEDLAEMESAGLQLGVAYRVHVRIYTATREGATIIPRTALFRGQGGNWEAFVVRNGKAVLTQLEVGLTNDTEAEVLKGMQPGDEVIVAPPATLAAGARVKKTG